MRILFIQKLKESKKSLYQKIRKRIALVQIKYFIKTGKHYD